MSAISDDDNDLLLPVSATNRRKHNSLHRRSRSFTPTTAGSKKKAKVLAAQQPTSQLPQQQSSSTAIAAGQAASPPPQQRQTAGSTPMAADACHVACIQHSDVSGALPTPSTMTDCPQQLPTAQRAFPDPAAHCCPVCGLDLGRVSDTEAGQAAHVNACLDAVAAADSDGCPAQHVDLTEAAGCACQQEKEQEQQEEETVAEHDDMQQWLEDVGAAAFAGVFRDAEIDLSVLPHLNDHDLQDLGIADNELRLRIMTQAAQEPADAAGDFVAAFGSQQQLPWQQGQEQRGDLQQQLGEGYEELHEEQLWQDSWPECSEEQWYCADADAAASQPGNSQQDVQQQQSGFDHQQQQPPQHTLQQQAQLGLQQQDRQHECHRLCVGGWSTGTLQQGNPQQQGSSVGQQRHADQQHWRGGGGPMEGHCNQLGDMAGPARWGGQQQQQQQEPWQQQQQQEPWQQQQQQQCANGYQGMYQQQGWQHRQQQQHTGALTGPLQPLDVNQQQQQWEAGPLAAGSSSAAARSHTSRQGPSGAAQSSITGFVTRVQPQPPQHPDAKEQWRALFKRPKQPLGAHRPAPREPRQAQLSTAGQVVLPVVQEPAAAAAAAAAAAGPLAALPQAPGPSLPSWWPAWQRLPGTNIIVDCFGRSSAAAGSNRAWVLSHFHADHYMGLSKGFKQGRIILTSITAALVRLKLKVPDERLVVLELGQELVVEGTRLQFIDANHCPGAAMIVAHPPGNAPPVLHTGDARLTQEATQSQPALQALVGKAVLVLDTTYADPAYSFPPQQQVLDWVLRAVKAELFNPRCLFLFGTYTIGKERLFLHVASQLQRKVYVAAAKRSIMACLGLPPQLAALLTTNHLDASIHAVPMNQVTLEAMESLLLRYKGRYTTVVGFKPTGWSHAGGSGAASAAGPSRSSMSIKPNRRRSQRGTVVLYQVPYSEHSSCAELRAFVEWFKPLRIIPSVNNDNGPKLRAMMAAITSSAAVTGPMDAFARRQQQPPAAN